MYTVVFGVGPSRLAEREGSDEDICDGHRRWKQFHCPLQSGLQFAGPSVFLYRPRQRSHIFEQDY